MRVLPLVVLVACKGGSVPIGEDTDTGSDSDSAVDPSAPTVVIDAPADGAVYAYDEAIPFSATATDLEDGALSGANLVWTSDLVTSALGAGASLNLVLPVPGDHLVTCTATDSDGRTGFATVNVTAESPYVRIYHPGDGEIRPSGSSVPFTGGAMDFEEGDLSAGLQWASSIDGAFGTGASFSAPLSDGTHVITATIVDGDGNAADASITLTLE